MFNLKSQLWAQVVKWESLFFWFFFKVLSFIVVGKSRSTQAQWVLQLKNKPPKPKKQENKHTHKTSHEATNTL